MHAVRAMRPNPETFRDGRVGEITIMTYDDKDKEGGMRQPDAESGGSQTPGSGDMNQPSGGQTSGMGQTGGIGTGGGMNQPSGGQTGGMGESGGTGQPQEGKKNEGVTRG